MTIGIYIVENKTGKRTPSNLGKHLSSNTKQKISDANKGNIPWNKDVKMGPRSEQTKKKHSNTIKQKYRNGYINPNKGKTWTKNPITGKREYKEV